MSQKYLFIVAEKHGQEKKYCKGLQGRISHPDRFVDEVDDSKIRPDHPKIFLSYLQGHVYDLDDAKDYTPKWKRWTFETLPIIIHNWKYHMNRTFNGGREHRDEIVDAIKSDDCEGSWLGSDPDLEGEGLGRGFYKHNGILNKLTGRIWVNHGLMPAGLAKTFKHIRDPKETAPRATASIARQHADWLIGINLSRAITLIAQKHGYRGVFTAGRVQTPTLALIAARRIRRQNFKPTTSYRLAFMDKNGVNFLGSVADNDGAMSKVKGSGAQITSDTDKGKKAMFKTPEDVGKALQGVGSAPQITKVQNQTRHQSAPKLPETSDLQGYLVKHAHITAKQAGDKVLEPLYDEYSAQTYPRTECNVISVDDFNALRKKLPQYKHLYEQIIGRKLPDGLFTNLKPRKKYVDFTGKKVQKQGHGAITPEPDNKVMNFSQYQKLTFPEKVSYRHVLACTLAMFANDHAYQSLEIEAKNDDEYTYKASDRTDKADSKDWKLVFSAHPKSNNKKIPVDDYHEGQPLTANGNQKYSCNGQNQGFYPKAETTSAPSAITESNLVGKVMKKYNLGTSSTRANIIARLKAVKLVVSAKKKDKSQNLVRGEFIPTDKGLVLLQLLAPSHLMNLSKVSSWENQMKQIADSKLSYDAFMKDIIAAIKDDVAKLPKHQYHFTIKPKKSRFKNIKAQQLGIVCPKCKKGKLQILSMDMLQNGTYIPIKFYSCTNRKCRFSCGTETCGVKITPDVMKRIIAGKTQYRMFHSPKKGDFPAKLVYYRGKVMYQFKPRKIDKSAITDITCPKCKKGHLYACKSKKGQTYYKCTNKSCKLFFWPWIDHQELNHDQIKKVLSGQDIHMDGFKKKHPKPGKPATFDTDVKCTKRTYRLEFDFHKK